MDETNQVPVEETVEETTAPVEEVSTPEVAVEAGDNSARIAELQAIENPTEEDKAELATLLG